MSSAYETLSSLPAIRERATEVYKIAKAGEASNFDLHEDRLDATVDLVIKVILGSFPVDKFSTIPPHGRWQHFETGDVPRLTKVLDQWESGGVDSTERCRRLMDLFLVSVLLDAGAGDNWKYKEASTGTAVERSEGLAVASLYMFLDGSFGGGKAGLVNGEGLKSLTSETLAAGMQASEANPLTGVEGRTSLLQSLGSSLLSQPDIFGAEGRPGKIVDYLLNSNKGSQLDVATLWAALQQLLLPIWPTDRTKVEGKAIGDAWPLSTLKKVAKDDDPSSLIQPFHKLTQWLTYSLMVPFVRLLNLEWTNSQLLTGLPEYRNGGLFVDMGVLTLKQDVLARGVEKSGERLPMFEPAEDVIVEWRALTVALLDIVHVEVNKKLRAMGATADLSLAQVLEAGTWKAGRVLAAEKRPETRSSPILIISDGTLF
ncbi:hypothetical protein AAFC00_005796 [Neodothiora populina]|uniref:DUF1688-domain-containing protein n=1 Tax=Neodothiora populina TaxID=2781224 RepID=A0ABR3P5W3_9PEZI